MLKIGTWLNKMYKKLMKIKIIKAFLGLITVIMSYKLVNYFFKFNKIIMYLLGLVFVGISWEDLKILSTIKLIYDDFKLYVLSFFNQDSSIIKNKTIETKNDIDKIIYKDVDTAKSPDSSIKKIKIEKVDDKSIFKSLRDYYKNKIVYNDQITISDTKGNEWTLSSILKDPLVILTIIALIIISGAVVISIYDITLDQITHFPLNVARMTWTGLSILFWKIISLFRRGGGQPPIYPFFDSDITLNAGPSLGVYNIKFIPDHIDAGDRFFKPHYMDSKTWLDLLDQVESRENDPNAIVIPYDIWLKKLEEARDNRWVFTSRETNEDILKSFENKDSSPINSSGSLTPTATGSNITLFSQIAFAAVADDKAYDKKGVFVNLDTMDEQAEYFSKRKSMAKDNIFDVDELLKKGSLKMIQ
jgi:hypothetical protein